MKFPNRGTNRYPYRVTSHTEVWIEIFVDSSLYDPSSVVTSHTEVWIEIKWKSPAQLYLDKVTSHTEVWIEIFDDNPTWEDATASPPIRRCGLKFIFTLGKVL